MVDVLIEIWADNGEFDVSPSGGQPMPQPLELYSGAAQLSKEVDTAVSASQEEQVLCPRCHNSA